MKLRYAPVSIALLLTLSIGLECGYKIGSNSRYQQDKKQALKAFDAVIHTLTTLSEHESADRFDAGYEAGCIAADHASLDKQDDELLARCMENKPDQEAR